MSRAWRLLGSPNLRDVVAIAGFGALIYGIAQQSTSVAWMTAGVLLMAAGIVPELRRTKRG